MKNQVILAAALACALTTVFLQRVLQPAVLLMVAYLEELFAEVQPQPMLAAVPAPVAAIEAALAKPSPARRRRATKAKPVT